MPWVALVALAFVTVCIAAPGSAAAGSRSGALVPLAGKSACLTEVEDARHARLCMRSRVSDIQDMAFAPDGRQLYVASVWTIWTFRRDPVSGTLQRMRGSAGCVRQLGRGACRSAHGLGKITSIVVSPDGRHVYAAASGSRSIAIFRRDPHSGTLTQLRGRSGCVSRSRSPCSPGRARGLEAPQSLEISGDGRSLYSASVVFRTAEPDWGWVAGFAVNRRTGALTQRAGPGSCVTSRHVSDCTFARGLQGAGSVAVSHDGRTVYAGSVANSVFTVFRRGRDGRIAQLPGPEGCVARQSSVRFRRRHDCSPARHLRDADSIVASSDDKSVYVFSSDDERLLIFRRDAAGHLSQPRGAGACVEWGRSPCRHARGFFEASEPVLSPDGRNLYAATGAGWATFRRLPTSGLIQPRGALACGLSKETIRYVNEGDDERCRHHRLPFDDLSGLLHAVASPDGRNVYFGAAYSLFSFRRL
jgi:DNA-binding beta-propeller fold protein YncE